MAATAPRKAPVPQKRRFKPVVNRPKRMRLRLGATLVALLGAVGVVQFYHPTNALGRTLGGVPPKDLAAPSVNAFGRSGEVKLLFSMPGDRVTFPLAVGDDPSQLRYEWTSARGSETGFAERPMSGADLATPQAPGFYYLTLIQGENRQVVNEPMLAVLAPFGEKEGSMLNGYRIGTYLSEKSRKQKQHPTGFLEVHPQYLDIALSKHLRLHHFLTHDDQSEVWPKYVALDPKLLDKIELVFSQLEVMQGPTPQPIDLDVNSGYRTPAHNSRVRRAVSDSRHQYGDAADVVIDANGNGRIDRNDHRLVEAAVGAVERNHPDLVGGLGVYTSLRYPTPYVHIDARGVRTRWRG